MKGLEAWTGDDIPDTILGLWMAYYYAFESTENPTSEQRAYFRACFDTLWVVLAALGLHGKCPKKRPEGLREVVDEQSAQSG